MVLIGCVFVGFGLKKSFSVILQFSTRPNEPSSYHSVSACPLICHRQSISVRQYQSLSVSLCQLVCVNHALCLSFSLSISFFVYLCQYITVSVSLSLCPCHSVPSALSLPVFLCLTLLGLILLVVLIFLWVPMKKYLCGYSGYRQ